MNARTFPGGPVLPQEDSHAFIEGLASDGYIVIPDFLSYNEVLVLLEAAREHQARDRFQQAGIGSSSNYDVNKNIRKDYIKWLDPEDANRPAQEVYFEKVRALIQRINRYCFLSLKDVEAHFSIFPPGAFYKRHLDQFKDKDHRKITVICYLNINWQEEDGGQLRMYVKKDGNETALDVLPVAGTLVCFRSDLLEHEVLVAHKDRYSITGWLLDQPVGLTFL